MDEQVLLFGDPDIVYAIIDSEKQALKCYWKDEKGQLIRSLKGLRRHVESKGMELVFAMNGGMFDRERQPVGLYIENGIVHQKINSQQKGYGNFFLQPNGIFFIDENKKATVQSTLDFKQRSNISYATQSGPMLVINGKLHPAFKKGSPNKHIRNGLGILGDGRVLFAISKKKINFYDFASFFHKNGCKNALYLDGFVSRAYIPEKDWRQKDGNFGVMIGVEQRP